MFIFLHLFSLSFLLVGSDILVSFSVPEGKFLTFNHNVCVRFFIGAFYQIQAVLFTFAKSSNHEYILNFGKFFFGTYL